MSQSLASTVEKLPEPSSCPVSAHTEWDPLEEVVVGRLEGSTIPGAHPVVNHNAPDAASKLMGLFGGMRYPRFLIRRAQKELDGFIKLLEDAGVTVRRPEVADFKKSFKTPLWRSRGFTIACPRDAYLVIGDEIIETPMSWRSRYFESHAYRPLFKEYFRAGARWTSAPKPELPDALYDYNYTSPEPGEAMRYVINEYEPVFDAADFVRCGRDIFYIKSNVTNQFGIDWLQRHLGDEYRLHEIISTCRQPMHIDSSFMPLAPGKVLVNPTFIDVERLPPMFKGWDVLEAPHPDPVDSMILRASMCSEWISVNVLMLDEKRVVVEENQPSIIKAMKDWGFEPIPCAFLHYSPFGGSFHCATLDVRRRGTLQSYF